MASPRFVAPPEQTDYASRYLQTQEEGFRTRWAAAEAAQDERYRADTAAYAARVATVQAQLSAAQKEVTAARSALAKLATKEPEAAAQAARELSRAARDRAQTEAIVALASKGSGQKVPEHVRLDEGEDAVQKYVAGLPSWADQWKKSDEDVQDALQASLDATKNYSPNAGINKLLAIANLEAGGVPPSVSLVDLTNAAVREALTFNQNRPGIESLFSKGAADLGLETAGTVYGAIRAAEDIVKGGNNPKEAADFAKKGSGGASKAKAEAKLEAMDEQNPAELAPDYTAARTAAEQRLADAEDELASIFLPTAPAQLGRIERTRNEYASAFGGGARVTPAPLTGSQLGTEDHVAALVEQLARQAPASSKMGPKADTPAARALEAEADAIAREPIPSTKTPSTSSPAARFLDPEGEAEPIDFGELDMSTVQSTPLALLSRGLSPDPGNREAPLEPTAKHRALLEAQGMIARDGTLRKARATRLAANTPEGRLARAALDDAGGDLDRALAKLRDDRARAIAVGLVA